MSNRSVPQWKGAHKKCFWSLGEDDQSSSLHHQQKKACVKSHAVPPAPRGRYTKPARMTGAMFQNYLRLAGQVDFLILVILSRSGETRRLRLYDQIFQQMQVNGSPWSWEWTVHRIKSLEKRRYIVNFSPRNVQGIYAITLAGIEALKAARGGQK